MIDQQHRIRRVRGSGVSGELSGIGQAGHVTVGQRDLQFAIGDQEPDGIGVTA